MTKKKTKFLLLGWDSADWKVINPLIDKGQMPALERLINKGVMGNIATLDPPLSPMLWTSIATGKYAFKHGVHGFLEGKENQTKIGAVTTKSIKTKTVWEILNQNGFKTNVVGWWPSHPAAPLDGCLVSNFHGKAPKDSVWNDWPTISNAVYPADLEEKLNELRVHPGELGMEQLVSFIPNYELLKEEDANFVNLLLADIAECLTVHSTSTYLAEHTDWDFMAVYYNAIDHISHVFMKYHSPKLPWIPQEKFDIYHTVIEAAYRFHDLMLERWLELVDDHCHVMVLSDHGFHSDEMRVKELPKEPAAIAREHNYLGMLTLKGPNIKQDELIYGSSLLDITPTILSIFGLAVGKDMDGKVLSSAYDHPQELKVVNTWDEKGKLNIQDLSQFENDELIKQLVDLGYVDGGNFESPEQVKKLLDENNFYLARSYFDARKYLEASLIANRLCADYPENDRYQFFLAKIYVELKEIPKLGKLITQLETILPKGSVGLLVVKGKFHYLNNEFKEALSIFKTILKSSKSGNAYLEYQIATTLLKLHDYKQAIVHFKKNLQLNSGNAHAMHGIGMASLGLKKTNDAIDALIDSVSITYFNPSAHFYLGIAFKQAGAFEQAEQAFLVARQMAPNMSKARLELLSLYEKELKNTAKAMELLTEVKRKSQGTAYVVSGLPRSGTSMMMQMLEAGGLKVLSDHLREANEDNPHGYYEHEAIKRLSSDNTIVYQAKDKAVKIIVNLLRFLPSNMDYKIVLMKRPVNEVVMSQDKMLQRLGKTPKASTKFGMDELLTQSYEQAKEFISTQQNISFVEVEYEKMLSQSEKNMQELIKFLDLDLNADFMLKKIDNNLHRNK